MSEENDDNKELRKKFRVVFRLDELLEKHGMSIRECARRTGYRYGTIRDIYNNESKQVPVDAIERLCTLFDCSISTLMVRDRINKRKDTGKIHR